jgi:hypothetical protein
MNEIGESVTLYGLDVRAVVTPVEFGSELTGDDRPNSGIEDRIRVRVFYSDVRKPLNAIQRSHPKRGDELIYQDQSYYIDDFRLTDNVLGITCRGSQRYGSGYPTRQKARI